MGLLSSSGCLWPRHWAAAVLPCPPLSTPRQKQTVWLLLQRNGLLDFWHLSCEPPDHYSHVIQVTFIFPLSFLPTSLLKEMHKKGKVTTVLRTRQEAQPQTLPQIHSSSTFLLREEQEARPSVDVASEYPDRGQLLGGGSFVYTKSRCLCGRALQIHCDGPGRARAQDSVPSVGPRVSGNSFPFLVPHVISYLTPSGTCMVLDLRRRVRSWEGKGQTLRHHCSPAVSPFRSRREHRSRRA